MQSNNITSNETGAAQEPTPMPSVPMPNTGENGGVFERNEEGNNQDNTRNPTNNNMGTLMNNGMGTPLDNNMGNQRWSPMDNDMRNPMNNNIGNQMGTPMNNNMPNRMGRTMDNNMSNQMENNMGNDQGRMMPNMIGTVISTHPRPNEPCRLCNPSNTRNGFIRFLNAAAGYNPFVIFVNENMVSSGLNFAEITEYERTSAGRQVITVMGENGYIYAQKPIDVTANTYSTIAVVNTDSGLDIQMIDDTGCDRGSNMSCIRAANLSYNSGPLSVMIGNQYVNFPNLRYRAVADFESIWPGFYIYTVSRNMVARFPGFGGTVLLAAALAVQKDRNYTIYLLNWKRDSSDSVKALVVEDM